MANYDDKINATLAADITVQLAVADARRALDGGLRLTDRELKIAYAVGGDRPKIAIVLIGGIVRRLVRHAEYVDIYYCLDGSCPDCRTDLLIEVDEGDAVRYDCGHCGLGLECWEKEVAR